MDGIWDVDIPWRGISTLTKDVAEPLPSRTLMDVADAIEREWNACEDRPHEIRISALGFGVGGVDRLAAAGLPVRGV